MTPQIITNYQYNSTIKINKKQIERFINEICIFDEDTVSYSTILGEFKTHRIKFHDGNVHLSITFNSSSNTILNMNILSTICNLTVNDKYNINLYIDNYKVIDNNIININLKGHYDKKSKFIKKHNRNKCNCSFNIYNIYNYIPQVC